MLKELLLFLIMAAGGIYGLWVMRRVDRFMKHRREAHEDTGRKVHAYIRRMPGKQEIEAA